MKDPASDAPTRKVDASERATLAAVTIDFARAETAPVADTSLVSGQQLGHYEIVRPLGRGGMGEVYEARDAETGRQVALKLLNANLSDEEARSRFLREGRLAAQIVHPNIVFVFATEEIDGNYLTALELMPGGTLADVVDEQGAMPVTAAVEAAFDMIAGLDAAHAKGILHRDIKPANCMITNDGAVKVGDFGLSVSIAPTAETQLTVQGTIMGTPDYASPEQMRGDDLDVRSDIYSVGATLYHLLTGRPPFEAENLMQLLTKLAQDKPVPPAEIDASIPKGLSAAVMRCLEKKPENRFATYKELEVALQPFGESMAITADLPRRLAAGLLDAFFIFFLQLAAAPLIVSLGGGSLLAAMADPETTELSVRQLLPYGVITAAYWLAQELLWHRTPGKRLLRMRLATADGQSPTPAAILLRTAVFLVPAMAPGLSGFESMEPALLALLFAPYAYKGAAVHDLISGTRVVRSRYRQRTSEAAADAEVPVNTVEGSRRLGPFLVPDGVSGTSVLEAYDEVLQRASWITEVEADAPPISESRRTLDRRTRLRWIGGVREEDGGWDAWEATGGTSFLEAVEGGVSWAVVRHWLRALVEELEAARVDRTLDERALSLRTLWIDGSGAMRVLDFPPPGDDAVDVDARASDTWKFAAKVAQIALTGADDGKSAALPAKPLPVSARACLEQFLAAEPDGEAITAALEGLQHRPVEPSRPGVLAQVGILGCFPLLVLVAGLMAADDARELLPVPMIAGLVAGFVGLASLPSTFAVRGGFLKQAFGMRAVLQSDGSRATRLRCLARGVVAWSPVLLLMAWTVAAALVITPADLEAAESPPAASTQADGATPTDAEPRSAAYRLGRFMARSQQTRPDLLALVLVPIFVVGTGAWVRTPSRGWQDRIVGTVLVPK